MARTISTPLAQILGTSVVVENKPGASGQIAASYVAKSAPDGYTIMLDASSFAVNPSLYPNLPYNPERDFKTLGMLALYPNVLLVHPSFPVRTVKELVNLAKSKPNSISFASSGNGSAQHLAGVLFTHKAKIEMQHVPYKGAAPGFKRCHGRANSSFLWQCRLNHAVHRVQEVVGPQRSPATRGWQAYRTCQPWWKGGLLVMKYMNGMPCSHRLQRQGISCKS
jgi:hypothetical protein